jgi:predicted lipid-binding transport protein (Tim44 family)
MVSGRPHGRNDRQHALRQVRFTAEWELWRRRFGFGDIIILLVIAGIIYFVYKRYKANKQMQMSTASPAGYSSYAYNEPAYDISYTPQPALGSVSDGLRHIAEMDPAFNEQSFRDTAEDLFFKIQGGWTRRDIGGITGLLTPQMHDIFQGDISRYLAEKKMNRLENIAVRQVEIVDAVQDQGEEFITVRYTASLLDFTTDETGTVLSGSPTTREVPRILDLYAQGR